MKPVGLFMCLSLCFICGCSARLGPVETPFPTATPNIVIAESKSAIAGYVISSTTNKALIDTPVRLARVFWDAQKQEGAYVLDGANSPSVLSQRDGRFVLENIDPGDYVIVVGDVFGSSYIVSNSDGTATIYTTKEGELLSVNTLRIDLP